MELTRHAIDKLVTYGIENERLGGKDAPGW
jgi:hypothetical protein